ncbi:MAG: OB-fold domain-containing protein [Burkholderiaceae bacterium]|nr:OB-fold domain-containing protein [Burkholderiaceae bacterium]
MSAKRGESARSEARVDSDPPALEALRGPTGERLIDPARGVLLGSFCGACTRTWFPQRRICPRCYSGERVGERALGRNGVIYASTIVRVPSSLGHKPPYAYGYVDLPRDGVRVFSRFSGSAPEAFEPGAAVEFVLEPVASNAPAATLAWAFRLETLA